MGYLFEAELRQEAEKFIEILNSIDIHGDIFPGSFRDYMVKVIVSRGSKWYGNANLYYSPTNKSFSLKTHELKDKSVEAELKDIWNKRDSLNGSTGQSQDISQLQVHMGYDAYVDGSYVDGPIGYGVVILMAGNQVFEISGTVQDATLFDMRQVGGELQAVYTALAWCKSNQVDEISIYYDYQGIECWANGSWKANKSATQSYAKFIQECGIIIKWNKVKSHTGNHWNEYVDILAKQGSRSLKTTSFVAESEISAVHEKAGSFVSWLKEKSVSAYLVDVLNDQFVRVKFEPKGQMDIYCTQRRSPDQPYLTNFTDIDFQQRVEAFWKSFYREGGVVPSINPIDKPVLAEVEYFYTILSPYRECLFDFSDFANALIKVCVQKGLSTEAKVLLKKTTDFSVLEKIYLQVKDGKQ